MRQFLRSALIITTLCIAGCFGASMGFGQTTSASLSGQVTDAGGAAVPGAKVSIRNLDTNLTQSVMSNAEGLYTISPLPPGPYTLTVETAGFQRYVQNGLVLTVNESATQ